MHRFHRMSLLIAALAFGAVAVASDPKSAPSTGPTAPTSPTTPMPPGGSTTGASKTEDLSDAQIASVLIAVNQGEIEIGRFMVAKATNTEVKRFAQTMVDDHTAMVHKVQDWQKKNAPSPMGGQAAMGDEDRWGPDPSDPMDPSKGSATPTQTDRDGPVSGSATLTAAQGNAKKELADLGKLSGAALDRAYVDAAVMDHREVLGLLDHQLPGLADDEALKNLMRDTRTKVASHLEAALRLQFTVGDHPTQNWTPGAAPAGARQ